MLYKLYGYYYNFANVSWLFKTTYSGYKWLSNKSEIEVNREDWVLLDFDDSVLVL
jgi:hypothetical protein